MARKSRWNKRTQRVRGHLRSLQLPLGLEPMLLVISRFLSAGEPDLVGPDGDFRVGRMSCFLPVWLGRSNTRHCGWCGFHGSPVGGIGLFSICKHTFCSFSYGFSVCFGAAIAAPAGKAGNKRRGNTPRGAIGHLVNYTPLAIAHYTRNQEGQDISAVK
jgi:hypothetical protein